LAAKSKKNIGGKERMLRKLKEKKKKRGRGRREKVAQIQPGLGKHFKKKE